MSARIHRLTGFLAAASCVALLSCARPPRPALLAEADSASQSPASVDAASQAPQAFARAEQLKRESQAAYDRGEVAASSILAERALVAYERAAVLARIARAAVRAESSRQELRKSEDELRALDAEQARLTADVEALEARIQVLKDAEPIAPSGKADPQREAARLTAAREILFDARLLCVAARMVQPGISGADDAESALKSAEAAVAAGPRPAAIDDARRVRARCLGLLTSARRAAATPATTAADQVLSELSAKGGLSPSRDDRGVFVPLPADRAQGDPLADIAGIAATHADFPMLIVAWPGNPASKPDQTKARAYAERIQQALVTAGCKTERIRIEIATAPYPTAKPTRGALRERAELVFVVPRS